PRRRSVLPACRLLLRAAPPAPGIYTLSLHDALPILREHPGEVETGEPRHADVGEEPVDVALLQHPERVGGRVGRADVGHPRVPRSEEHTSELQSRENLVCRLLLEKKKTKTQNSRSSA